MQQAWLDQVSEDVIDAERPICDAHHHLWDNADNPYLLPQLLSDTGSGHNIVSTVFVECSSMYRTSGDDALKPVGETEFVNATAAMMSSSIYGEMRGCANLLLGTAVGPVLDEHLRCSSRFRGIRHAAALPRCRP